MSKLTHFNTSGEAHMVDIGQKAATHRVAVSAGEITMQPETLALIKQGNHKKGDVLGIARIAGIMASVPVLLVLTSILGGFELIVLSMQVGMFAGMTGAMTSSVQWSGVAGQGVIVGLLVQMLLHVADRSLSGDV